MNRLIKRWDSTAVGITIIIGVLLSGITAYLNYQLISDKTAAEFHREAENQVSALEKQIEVDLAILPPTVGFFKSSDFIDRDEFHVFGQNIKVADHSMKALSWIPRVFPLYALNSKMKPTPAAFLTFVLPNSKMGNWLRQTRGKSISLFIILSPP